MTPAGWIFMILSWTFIITLVVYSFGKILSKK